MQLKFYLRKNKIDKDGFCPLVSSLTFKSDRIRTQIKGVKVKEKYWKDKEQRIKPNLKSEDYNYHIEFNKKIGVMDKINAQKLVSPYCYYL